MCAFSALFYGRKGKSVGRHIVCNVPRIRIEADKKAVVKYYLTTEINNN